jgi:hypothetical protein
MTSLTSETLESKMPVLCSALLSLFSSANNPIFVVTFYSKHHHSSGQLSAGLTQLTMLRGHSQDRKTDTNWDALDENPTLMGRQ